MTQQEAVVYECELHIRYGKECVEDFNATSKLKAIGRWAGHRATVAWGQMNVDIEVEYVVGELGMSL